MASATFSDLQAIANQLVNDNTAQNNAVAAQIQEVKVLLSDWQQAVANGNGGPSADDIGQVVAQLTSVHQSIQANTQAIQDSGAEITEADPHTPDQGGSIPVSQTGTGTTDQSSGTPLQTGSTGENSGATLTNQ